MMSVFRSFRSVFISSSSCVRESVFFLFSGDLAVLALAFSFESSLTVCWFLYLSSNFSNFALLSQNFCLGERANFGFGDGDLLAVDLFESDLMMEMDLPVLYLV